jgi:VWFA-related protein
VVFATLLVTLALADTSSVRIATTVTDRQGRAVQGLTVKDFEIKEDGVVQRIDTVEVRKPEARRLAILLDEFHVDAANSQAVRDALMRFIDERLRDGDSAVVLKPLDSLPSIKLTTDRDALRRAIASFDGRKGLYDPRTPLEAETLGSAPALVEAGRAQIVLSALRALAAQLGTGPGRSAILLVTEGFTAQPRRSTVRGLPDADMVERFANRYDVPIYAFDPRASRDDNDPGSATLARLVTLTGGTLSLGPDLAGSVARAASELDGGYTIVYTSAHGDDGRYHPVEVTMPRREADARARAGYVSAPSPEMRRALRALTIETPPAPPRMLKRSSLVQVWSGVTNLSTTGATVAVTWQPSATGVAGLRSPAARVAITAKTADGKLLYQGMLGAVRSGAPAAADSDRAEFGAPIGRVQLDMTILDMAGLTLDTDSRDLEIPVLKNDVPVLLPPIVIATQSAREFRDSAASADAAPIPAREFRRTERLIIRVPAYATGGAMPVTARLLNRVGQTMKDLDVMPGDTGGVTQFDLNLAPLAPGDYFLQFTIQGPAGPVSQRVSFKVTG